MPQAPRTHYHGFVSPAVAPAITADVPQVRFAAKAQAAAPQARAPAAAGLAPQHPTLPDVIGPQAPMAQVQWATDAAFGDDGDVSGFTAYSILERAACKSQQMQGTLRRGANVGMFAAKLREVQLTQAQTGGQSRSAKLQFIGSLATVVASGASGIAGSYWLGPVASQVVSQGMQSVGKPGIDVIDRTSAWGGTFYANEAGLGLKRIANDVQALTQQEQTSRAAQDQAQEERRSAATFIANYIQRKNEVSDRAASR